MENPNAKRKLRYVDMEIDQQNKSTQLALEDAVDRRLLRSKYLDVINKINDKREDLVVPGSEKFNGVIDEVEKLHKQVQKPREQVADAEALLGIVDTFATSVRSEMGGGLTPSEFISCLLRDFGKSGGIATGTSIDWKKLGVAVAPIFRKFHGCCTMIGPMGAELKPRKTRRYRRHVRPTQTDRPEEVKILGEKTDTDKNMATMFEILKSKKRVLQESLILNRLSFAQTVENLFALSFLVKECRVEITVDEKGSHYVSPKNAPAFNSVSSGKVAYSHFVFRLDFKDWKLMKEVVPEGAELMPHRCKPDWPASPEKPAAFTAIPIRKFSRNKGLVVLNEPVKEEFHEEEGDAAMGAIGVYNSKPQL
ncbi:hypothetical protein UlMin_043572 [Ulmus minor]